MSLATTVKESKLQRRMYTQKALWYRHNGDREGNERGKGISPLYMACRERRTRANLPDINPTIPQSHIYPLP